MSDRVTLCKHKVPQVPHIICPQCRSEQMSSIHDDNHSHLAKSMHRAFHEIDERVDWYQKDKVDIVAEIVEMWEDWKEKNLKKNDDGSSYKLEIHP